MVSGSGGSSDRVPFRRSGTPPSPISSASISSGESTTDTKIEGLRDAILAHSAGEPTEEIVLKKTLELREHPLTRRDVVNLTEKLHEYKIIRISEAAENEWIGSRKDSLISLLEKGDAESCALFTLQIGAFIRSHLSHIEAFSKLEEQLSALEKHNLEEPTEDILATVKEEGRALIKAVDTPIQEVKRVRLYQDNIHAQKLQLKEIAHYMEKDAVLPGVVGFSRIVHSALTEAYDGEKKLGEGSFGVAYLRGKQVHKVLKGDASKLATRVSDALQEMRTGHLVGIKGVAAPFTFAISKKRDVIVLSRYEKSVPFSGALFDRKEKCYRFPAVSCIRRVALSGLVSLAHMHERGLVHCDVKPDNLLLSKRSETIVIDFGLVERSGSKTRGGTRYYLPPEIHLDTNKRATPAVDQWALGASLFELVSQDRRFIDYLGRLIGHKEGTIGKLTRVEIAHSIQPILNYYVKNYTKLKTDIEEHLRRMLPEEAGREAVVQGIVALLSPDPKERKTARTHFAKTEIAALTTAEAQRLVFAHI